MSDKRTETTSRRGSALTRRAVLRDAGTASLALAGVGVLGCGDDDAPSATREATAPATSTPGCMLAPEQVLGPYYVDLAAIRSDVAEGRPGVPLELELKLVDGETCEPLSDAALDVWHADALGVYSGFEAEGTPGETFMRGTQLTGSDGIARFRTVYPGFYEGRATHVHVMAHVGGSIEGGRYSGGEVAHTGQLYFSDKLTDGVYELEPYAQRDGTRVRLSEDFLFTDQNGARMHLTELRKGSLQQGLLARMTLGVATNGVPQ